MLIELKMKALNRNNYYVIQFTELPYESVEKYTIVPRSWIKICESRNVVLIAYPIEDPEKTRIRVQKNKKHRKKWNFFEALLRYESSNYNDAYAWIAAKNIFNSVYPSENNDSSHDPGNNTVIKNVCIDNMHSNTSSTDQSVPPEIMTTSSAVVGTSPAHDIIKSKKKLNAWKIKKINSLKLSFTRAVASDQILEACNKRAPQRKKRSYKINNVNRRARSQKKISKILASYLHGEGALSSQDSKVSHTNEGIPLKLAEIKYIHQIPSQNRNDSPVRQNCSTLTKIPSSNQSVPKSKTSQVELDLDSFDYQVQHSHREINTDITTQMPTLQKILLTSSAMKKTAKANLDSPTKQFETQKTDATPANLQQNIKSNIRPIPTAEQNAPNRPSQSSGSKPIIKGLLLEDPCTGILFLRKLDSPSEQIQSSVNQMDISIDKCKCRPPVQIYTDYTIQESNSQQCLIPISMTNPDTKCSPHNIPAVVQNSPCPHNKQTSPVPPDNSELQRNDDTEIRKSTENNPTATNHCDVINIEDKPFAIENAESKTNQLLPRTLKYQLVPAYNIKSEVEITVDSDDHHDEIINYNTSSQNVVVKRTVRKKMKSKGPLVLPPEYNPYNTRWTLKHQKPGPGIVELKPNTQVYINARRFEQCKRQAKNSNALARLLLMEIFTLKALRVCDLTGAKFLYGDNSKTRPGLDECARWTLLNFVEEYGVQKYGRCNIHAVVDSIRYKMRRLKNDG